MYLGKPLCAKHWIMISDLPLEKARKKLGFPCPIKTEPILPEEPPIELPDEARASSEPARPPATGIDARQMDIFKESQVDQEAGSGTVHSLPLKKSPRQRANAKRDKKATQTSEHHSVQQNLFGEAKEEAS